MGSSRFSVEPFHDDGSCRTGICAKPAAPAKLRIKINSICSSKEKRLKEAAPGTQPAGNTFFLIIIGRIKRCRPFSFCPQLLCGPKGVTAACAAVAHGTWPRFFPIVWTNCMHQTCLVSHLNQFLRFFLCQTSPPGTVINVFVKNQTYLSGFITLIRHHFTVARNYCNFIGCVNTGLRFI